MKGFYFLLFFGTINLALAQIPILTSPLNPSVGDNYEGFKIIDTTAVDLSLTGPDLTWSIPATSIATGAFATFTGEAVSSTPYASFFSGSDVGIKNSFQNAYDFYSTSSAQLELDGYGTSAGITFFTDPAILMTYPFTYTSTVTDNVAGKLTVSTSFTLNITGTTSSTADAYGSLTLPSGTYQVLRVKKTLNALASNGGGTVSSNVITYGWYSDLYKFPLMQIDISKTSGTGIYSSFVNDTTIRAFTLTPELLTIEERKTIENFELYPNPVQNKATLSFSIEKPSLINASLINTLGQEWKLISEKKSAGSHNETIDMENFSKGVYILRLSVDGTVTQKKIIIQ